MLTQALSSYPNSSASVPFQSDPLTGPSKILAFSTSSILRVFPSSSGRSGFDVGGALSGVALVGGGSAVAAEHRVVKTGCALLFALRAAACVEVGGVGPGTYGAGGCGGATEAVMAVAEAGCALCRCVKANVGSALEASSKEEEAFKCLGGLGASSDGEDHGGGLFSLPLAFFRQPSGGAVEGNARVELFHLVVYLVKAGFGGGDGGGDVVDDNLHYLDLFLEASGRREKMANSGLKLCSGLEEVIGSGGGDSDELNVVVG
ncbi:hypothetical protein Q9L58_010802, partial [Maublancomyces gigas]